VGFTCNKEVRARAHVVERGILLSRQRILVVAAKEQQTVAAAVTILKNLNET
jgi:hypothetical protein